MPIRKFDRLLVALLCLLLACVSAAPRSSPVTSQTIVISHVAVIPMDEERLLEDRTVMVRDGKIWKITGGSERVPSDALHIDGRGKYLMPGLADLHVHLFSPDDLTAYVVNGVTTVLNMDGGPDHLSWRSEVRDGKLLGPTIHTAGHTIDGFPPLNEMFLTAETPEQGRALVREQRRAGYDVVKLYGTLRPEVFRAILDEAAKQKIPVVGHVNRQIGVSVVLNSSQALAAHLEDLLSARFDHPPSDAELEDLANDVARSRMTVTPNLNVNPTNIAQLKELEAVLKSKDAKLLSPTAYSQWLPTNNRNERNDQTPQQIEFMKGMQGTLYKMVRLLQVKRVRLVLGTDAAPYGIPGLSAHQELQEMVEAGSTPYEALRTATQNVGAFIAENVTGSTRFGTVTEGSRADLLLLSSNPLNDIRHTQEIAGVVLRGRWLSATDLQKVRAAMETRFDRTKKDLERADAALERGDVRLAKATNIQDSKPPSFAEWVLMSKARKIQDKNMAGALRIARLNTQLYPHSFSSHLLLADLLFQTRNMVESRAEIVRSLAIEPHNAASANLAAKISAASKIPVFSPAGMYRLEYVNDQTHEAQKADLLIESDGKGLWRGKKVMDGQSSPLRSVVIGGDRVWALADSGYGAIEFRIVVRGSELAGYWAGAFGQNGTIKGTRRSPDEP